MLRVRRAVRMFGFHSVVLPTAAFSPGIFFIRMLYSNPQTPLWLSIFQWMDALLSPSFWGLIMMVHAGRSPCSPHIVQKPDADDSVCRLVDWLV